MMPQPIHAGGERAGQQAHPLGDASDAGRAVVDAVHRGHDGQQHLGGADVARRLLAADVLLAGLQRQAVGRLAVGVLRDADESAGQLAGVLLAAGHERRVRPAVAHRHAEPLRVADRDVGTPTAPFTRRRDEAARQQIGGRDDEAARVVRGLRQFAVVADDAVRRRILYEDAEDVFEVHIPHSLFRIQHFQVDADAARPRADNADRLRVTVGRDDESVLLRPFQALGHRHRLRRRRRLVEEARVRQRQGDEVADHLLKHQERL